MSNNTISGRVAEKPLAILTAAAMTAAAEEAVIETAAVILVMIAAGMPRCDRHWVAIAADGRLHLAARAVDRLPAGRVRADLKVREDWAFRAASVLL